MPVGLKNYPYGILLILAVLCSSASTRLSAQSKELKSAALDLKKAVSRKDPEAFLEGFTAVLDTGERRAIKIGVDAYVSMARVLGTGVETSGEYYYLHSKAANAFKDAKGKYVTAEIEKIRKNKRADWRGRLLILDAACFKSDLDLEASCIEALDDKAPQIVRRSLHYLRRSKKVPIVEKMVERYVAIETKRPSGDAAEWERALLTFQSSLQQMLHVDLPAAVDWKNYVAARKDRADFFEPEKRGSARTALTLFGAAVTGKNICFILDVSGSMLSTDPAPRGADEATRRRTVVGDPARKGPREPPEERRRITRAKKELVRVVKALPSDVKFNLVSYSSDVDPWQEAMVKSSKGNKQEAGEYVEELRAEGVTVTDLALEEAFSDLSLDTIYLVTDGAPTHVGSSGQGDPEDSAQIVRAIHKRMKELNFLRDVRIFTLGFKGAKEEFLKRLSQDHGGRYVAIE